MKAVIFDLDGTLLDTAEGILESAGYAAKQMGFEALPPSTMLHFVGPPIQSSFIKYYGCTPEQAQRAADIFRSYYKENALFKARLYPDMTAVLQEIKARGIKMAVATYKREDYALAILEHFNVTPFCLSMHGADNDNRLTKADILNLCIEELAECGQDVVLVGDTEYDAIGAEKAGVPFLGVTYGFGFRTDRDVNDYPNIGCAHNTREILNFI